MIKAAAGLCVLILLFCWGCTPQAQPPASSGANRQIQGPWQASQSSHVQVQAEPLGQLPNSGLQLPVVSPDGKWIAYLDFRSNQPIELAALFTGQGLEAMSLHVQPVTPGAAARTVCASGAAWPAWSPDSRRLMFVAYNKAGRCDLGIHDVFTGTTRRISMGLERIMMPAVSPSGKQAAVVVLKTEDESSSLYVVNLDTGKVEQTCPTDFQDSRQLWPQWTTDGRIVFVLSYHGRSWLAQWEPGKFPPEKLCEIRISASQSGVYQALAGLGRPLSPDDRYFAYYNTVADRIVLLSLADGRCVELPVGTRAGCWFGSGRFVAADQKQMRLFSIRATMPALLMRGLWLPRGANAATSQLLLCSRAAEGRAFALVRMKILSVE